MLSKKEDKWRTKIDSHALSSQWKTCSFKGTPCILQTSTDHLLPLRSHNPFHGNVQLTKFLNGFTCKTVNPLIYGRWTCGKDRGLLCNDFFKNQGEDTGTALKLHVFQRSSADYLYGNTGFLHHTPN